MTMIDRSEQPAHRGLRGLELLGAALEGRLDAVGQGGGQFLQPLERLAERDPGPDIEGQGHRRQLAGVVDRQGADTLLAA